MAYKLQLKRGASGSLPTGSAGEPLFTTDTNDLYIGTGASNQRYQKYIASGTSSQFLKGDGSLDSNTYYLASNPSAFIALTALTASAPLSYNNTTGAFTIAQASGSVNGFLSSTDWTTFNNKQNTITNPVTGTGTTNYLPKWTSGSAIGNSIVQDYGDTVWVGANTSGYGTLNLQRYVSAPYATLTLTDDATPANEVGIYLRANGTNPVGISSAGAPIAFYTSGPGNTERARITSGGNLLVNSTTDNGNRLQVTGNVYFSGNVGIGETTPLYPIHITSSTNARVFIKGTTNFTSTQIANDSGSLFLVVDDSTGSQTGEVYSRAILSTGVTPLLFILNGSEKMRLNSSGNLGLGTASPSGKLDVFSSSDVYANISTSGNATSAVLSLYNSLGVTDGAAIGYNVAMRFGTITGLNAAGFSEKMRLNSSGNFGLGVQPSAWGSSTAMQVGSWAALSSANAYGTGVGFNTYYNGTNHIYSFTNNATMLQLGVDFKFLTAAYGTAGNAITFTQAMTLTANGRLLLGTTTEGSELLQVNGMGSFTSSLDALFYKANGYAIVGLGGTEAQFAPSSYWQSVAIRTNNVDRLNISSTGAATFSSSVTASGIASLGIGETTNLAYIGDRTTVNTRYIRFDRASALTDIVNIQGFNGGVGDASIALQAYGSNVLIGTTTDSGEKLQVNGGVKIGTYLYLASEGTGSVIGDISTGNYLRFLVSNGEKMRIKSNGSVRYIPMATPGTAEAGDVYYDSTSNKLRCYNGTSWNDLF